MISAKIAKKVIWPVVRNGAIGGVVGGISGRFVSSSEAAPRGQAIGSRLGVVTGAFTGLPFGRLALRAQQMNRIYIAGLKVKRPGSTTEKVLSAADKIQSQSRVIFRRVRGRVIAIKGKRNAAAS